VTGSEVDFNGSADQNIPAFTFNKLTVSTSGIKKILAAVIVSCLTVDIIDNASIEINADGGGRPGCYAVEAVSLQALADNPLPTLFFPFAHYQVFLHPAESGYSFPIINYSTYGIRCNCIR
jgi:hypothetical protein